MTNGVEKETSNFTMFNVAEVLRLQLHNSKYCQALREGLKLKEECENKNKNPEDRIYREYVDGDIVQALAQDGPLKWKHMLSFSLFVDGMKLFRTSKTGLTGAYLVNTMLPLKERFKCSNMIVVALIASEVDMSYSEFIDRVVTNIRMSLELKGVHITCPNNSSFIIGGLVTSVILDIKERDQVLCMNGGYYRCPHCYIYGTLFGRSLKFPPTINIKARTNASFRVDATIAEDEYGLPMRGLLGQSSLLKLDYFDPTLMVPIEVMHTFDLGIVPYFMRAWMGKLKLQVLQDAQPDWVLTGDQRETLCTRLSKVQLPHGFTRSFDLHDFESWKADSKFVL
jgi:hypothetical protein